MDDFSKKISKNDEASKDFIRKLLGDNDTHGLDIDSIYHSNGKWVVLEFLKCESEYVSPHTSHPRNYPWNWKKFVTLFYIAQQLNGDLYLVNYSDRAKDSNEVRLMKVSGINKELIDRYIKNKLEFRTKLDYLIIDEKDDIKMSYKDFENWFIELNNLADMKFMI